MVLEEGWQPSQFTFELQPELAQPIIQCPHPFTQMAGFLPTTTGPPGPPSQTEIKVYSHLLVAHTGQPPDSLAHCPPQTLCFHRC